MNATTVVPAPQTQSAPAAGTQAIRIDRLTKRYGTFVAVDDLSLSVEDGDFFAFLGPNGAGKTTTINAIVGLVRASVGRIAIFGHDTTTDWRAARRLVGLAPQEYNFDRYLSIRDVLIYQAGYYGLSPRQVGLRADELLERFGLASKSREVFTKLSGGMKRRLSLARALIHSPHLLILDEPTAGVDVELRLELWELLRELNVAGTTIFLTTHYLEEAEMLCRNVGIIEGGRLVALEPTSRLLGRHGGNVLSVRYDGALPPLPAELAARVQANPITSSLRVDGVEASQIGDLVSALVRSGVRIATVEFGGASLQDVFLELTRK